MSNPENVPEAKYTLNVKHKKPINLSTRKILFYVGGFIAIFSIVQFLGGPVRDELKMREAERSAEFIKKTSEQNDDEHS